MAIGSWFTSLSDSLFRLLFKFLFRYDVFISYARRDGKDYALKLRDQLKALDFSCFLDFDELPAGNSLNKTLRRAIRKSATLVVVGTERAIKSRYVELEIGEFARTNRAIIPIDIGGTLADPPWSVIKERDIVWIDESADSLAKGVPSPNVADSIDKLFKYTRRNTRVRGQVFATTMLFFVGATLAIFLIQGKVKALNVAKAEAQEQQQRAEEATAIASQQEERARAAIAEADAQKAEAARQKNNAEKAAATAKKKEAEALANAEKAQENAERADDQRRHSDARRLYNDSRNTLDDTAEGLELSALLSVESLKSAWTQDAYETWGRVMDLLPDSSEDIILDVKDPASSVAFSPDGRTVAAGGRGSLTLFKTGDGKKLVEIPCKGEVMAVSFSPDGRWIAFGDRDEGKILDAKTLTVIKVFSQNHDLLRHVIFSPDSHYLGTTSVERGARLYETENWNEVLAPTLKGTGHVLSAVFSPDSRWFVIGGVGVFSAWNIGLKKPYEFKTDSGDLWDMAVGVTKAEGVLLMLATASSYGTARLWSLKTYDGESMELFDKEKTLSVMRARTTRALAISPDGRYIAAGGGDHATRIWDLETGKEKARKILADEVRSISFSPDGNWVATASFKEVRLWKVENSKEARRIKLGDKVLTSAFNPSGTSLAALSEDQVIRIFDTTEWKELRTVKSNIDAANLLFSPDGKWLVASGAGNVDVYDALRLTKITSHVFAEEEREIGAPSINLSPDGRWLVANNRSDLQLMDVTSRRWSPKITHKDSIEAIAFSPDGNYVMTRTSPYSHRAVLLRPSMIRVWESATGKEVAWRSLEDEDEKRQMRRPQPDSRSNEDDFPLEKQGGRAALLSQAEKWRGVSFRKRDEVSSPDNSWKAVKGQITLLKESSHDKILSELRHGADVNDLTFSPDSRWLVTASDDHTLRVWPLRPSDMIDQACARLRRNLNDEEWKQYMQGERLRKTCRNIP